MRKSGGFLLSHKSNQMSCIMCLCMCAAAAAVPETRRSVPHHCQHSDERPELPLARHLHHPPLSDASLSAANGEFGMGGGKKERDKRGI